MKKLILAAVLLLSSAVAGNATVLDFEGLALDTQISNGYGGLNWNNMYVLNATTYGDGNNGYTHGLVSGNNVAYNAYGLAASVTTGEFDFNGAFLTGAWNNGLNINVRGLNDGIVLYNTTVVVDSYSPTYFNFNYQNIDQVVFDSFGGYDAGYLGGGNHFAMDNFSFNEAAPVPEPGTMVLLGIGMFGLAVYGKRRAGSKKA